VQSGCKEAMKVVHLQMKLYTEGLLARV